MGTTTIHSSWVNTPHWADGWPVLNNGTPSPLPSLWLIDAFRTHALLADHYTHTLSEAESARAARYHQHAHRVRYQATHTALRLLLANATQQDAAALYFLEEQHHKPCLAAQPGQTISFNLSHTENLSLLGVTHGPAVGIDIEWLNRPLVLDDMLQACFSAAEIAFITAQRETMRYRFFTLWTRKEAILKLTGEGIGEHLPFFAVLDGTSVAEKEIIGGDPADQIYLYSFPIGEAYIGCYATTEPVMELPAFQL